MHCNTKSGSAVLVRHAHHERRFPSPFALSSSKCERATLLPNRLLQRARLLRCTLLYGHALGEIARLIDVGAALDGDMIGQKLEGNREHDRREEVGGFRHD